jgi:four helix bundle protein
MAHGSCGELETPLSLSQDLGFVGKDSAEDLYRLQEEVSKLLKGLILSLSKPPGEK